MLDVHPYSVPQGIGTDSSGKTLLIAEGGALAIIEDADATGDYVSPPRYPLGDGAIPIKLLVDPEADLTNGVDDAHDLVYLACGRSGLWVANLGDDQGAGPSALVDDSGNINPAVQESRRWCNDLALMTVNTPQLGGGTAIETYLVVLFAKKSGTRLRVYDLDDVRAVMGTGLPIAPLHNILIDGHTSVGTEAGKAFGYGLDVDDTPVHETTLAPLPGKAFVYVAAGAQGLARVEFKSSNILQSGPAPPGTGATSPQVEWGPVFGTGTYYADFIDPLWENFAWIDTSRSPPEVQRSEPPVFLDVAVARDGATLDIYTAHDQHGWVRFRHVSGAGGIAFSPSMPIDHQEGEVFTNPWGETQVSIAEKAPGERDFTYVHHIAVFDGDGEDLVIAGASCTPRFSVSAFLADEGPVLDFVGLRQGGVGTPLDEGRGAGSYTCLYVASEIDAATSGARHSLSVLNSGGSQLSMPAVQDVTFSPTAVGDLVLFLGTEVLIDGSVFSSLTARVVFEVSHDVVSNEYSATASVTHTRVNEDRPGKFSKGVGPSLADDSFLVFSANDGGRSNDGPMVLCGDELSLVASPSSPELFFLGSLTEFSGQWLSPTTGSSFATGGGGGTRFAVREFQPGDPCGGTVLPRVTRFWNVEDEADRFGEVGRKFHQGYVNAVFDSHLTTTTEPSPWLMITAPGQTICRATRPLWFWIRRSTCWALRSTTSTWAWCGLESKCSNSTQALGA